MSLEQMAQSLIALTEEDEVSLRSWSAIEDATFAAYASAYVGELALVCKGCHTNS
ncbi:hypothetical protein ACIP5Y_24165 [Nocardia sp. NPDC088792]|uniref:hypothetical protein n=1 Tax=Nocardia sp. NPDC088792 TaxID=3364332 RepID=UPI0037F4B6E9